MTSPTRPCSRWLPVALLAMLLASLGCIIEDTGEVSYAEKRACVDYFESSQFQQLYDLRAQCGETQAVQRATLKVYQIEHRAEEVARLDGAGALHGEVRVYSGPSLVQNSAFTSTCTQEGATLHLRLSTANRTTREVVYRCPLPPYDDATLRSTCEAYDAQRRNISPSPCAVSVSRSPETSIYRSGY